MLFTFSREEYLDMHLVYKFYNGNVTADVEYQWQFPWWRIQDQHLHCYSLFTNEAQFTHSGINSIRNSHLWAYDDPHRTAESNSNFIFL